MGAHGNGRRYIAEKYDSVKDYLDNYLFKVKDTLLIFKKEELAARKKYLAAANKCMLQGQRLERAYNGLEHFREK